MSGDTVPWPQQTCSECKAHFEVTFYGSPTENPARDFCPNCGANLGQQTRGPDPDD